MKLGGLNFRLCVLIHFAYNILTPSTGVMSLVQASSVACHTTVVKHVTFMASFVLHFIFFLKSLAFTLIGAFSNACNIMHIS